MTLRPRHETIPHSYSDELRKWKAMVSGTSFSQNLLDFLDVGREFSM